MSALKLNHVDREIESFIADIQLGIDFFENAGRKLMALKKKDPDVFDRITERAEWITRPMLEVIHLIGERKLHPAVYLLPQHTAAKVAQLPYAEQTRLLDEGVEVATERQGNRRKDDIGKTEVVPLNRLSKSESAAVFAPNGSVRKPDEQIVARTERSPWTQTGAARAFARRYNKQQVIIISINPVNKSILTPVVEVASCGDGAAELGELLRDMTQRLLQSRSEKVA